MKATLTYRIGLAVLLVAFGVGLLPSPALETKPTQTAAAVKPFVDGETLAGAVMLVADKDKVLGVDAIGRADIGAQRPMMVDMLFWIASMSKPITAAALMMLVDEGKVNLDDPVEKYLPEFKGMMVSGGKGKEPRKPDHPFTVREVLNHTSGLIFRSKEEEPTIDVLPLKEAIQSYAKTQLMFEPGTNYSYSNAGTNVAGRIIEVASGMSYEEFLDKRLLGPLGMKDTTLWPSEEQLKRLAKSYKPAKDKKSLEETTVTYLKYPLSDKKSRFPSPGGGFFSTASDCAAFGQMLLNGGVHNGKQLLSEAAVKELSKRQTGKDIKSSYGLCFAVDGEGFGHGGAYATNLRIDTKRGLVLVWMVQHNGFPGNGGQSYAAFQKAAFDQFAK